MRLTTLDPYLVYGVQEAEQLRVTYPGNGIIMRYLYDLSGLRVELDAALQALNAAETELDEYQALLNLTRRDLARVDNALPTPAQAVECSRQRHVYMDLVEDLERWLDFAQVQHLDPAKKRFADAESRYANQLAARSGAEYSALYSKSEKDRTPGELNRLYVLEQSIRNRQSQMAAEAQERADDRRLAR